MVYELWHWNHVIQSWIKFDMTWCIVCCELFNRVNLYSLFDQSSWFIMFLQFYDEEDNIQKSITIGSNQAFLFWELQIGTDWNSKNNWTSYSIEVSEFDYCHIYIWINLTITHDGRFMFLEMYMTVWWQITITLHIPVTWLFEASTIENPRCPRLKKTPHWIGSPLSDALWFLTTNVHSCSDDHKHDDFRVIITYLPGVISDPSCATGSQRFSHNNMKPLSAIAWIRSHGSVCACNRRVHGHRGDRAESRLSRSGIESIGEICVFREL
jgi:hypothetical protein